MVKYRIRQTSTGLYFQGYEYNYGLRKDGKPRATGKIQYHFKFGNDDKTEDSKYYMTLARLNEDIEWAIRNKLQNELEGCEVLAYKLVPTKTAVKLDNIKTRIEGNLIMDKLKGK